MINSALSSIVFLACSSVVLGVPHNSPPAGSPVTVSPVSFNSSVPATTVGFGIGSGIAIPAPTADDGGSCNLFPTPSSFGGEFTTAWATGSAIYFPPVQTITVTQYECGGFSAFPSGPAATPASSSFGFGSGSAIASHSFPGAVSSAFASGSVVASHAFPSGAVSSAFASASTVGSAVFPSGPVSSVFASASFISAISAQTGFPNGTFPDASVPTFAVPIGGEPVACYCYPIPPSIPASCGFPSSTGGFPTSTAYATFVTPTVASSIFASGSVVVSEALPSASSDAGSDVGSTATSSG